MFLITVGPSSDRRRQVEKPKGKLKRSENPLHQCQMESGVGLIVSKNMPKKQSKRGTRALPSKSHRRNLSRRPLVQRLAAKRHHDSGKSGQCDRDLGGGREGFTWFHRFGLDTIQGTQTNAKFGRVDCLRQFETRSLPALSRSYPRHFTFYVAHPIRS